MICKTCKEAAAMRMIGLHDQCESKNCPCQHHPVGTGRPARTTFEVKAIEYDIPISEELYNQIAEDSGIDHGTIDDGFGSIWPRCSADCDLEVVRPGRAQCSCQEAA